MKLVAANFATVLVVVVGLSTSVEAASPPVKVALRSSWPAHSLVAEFLLVARVTRHYIL